MSTLLDAFRKPWWAFLPARFQWQTRQRTRLPDSRTESIPGRLEPWPGCAELSTRLHGEVIRVRHLVKKYGALAAVQDVSFEVNRGEIFAFLGPNGAGKTTTIKMLTTLLKPASGELELDGLDPTNQPHAVRQRFGIVFQDSSLDDELTAYENLDFHCVLYSVPRRARAERIERLLRLFQLHDRRDDVVKHFSGGMKRRLEIARCLLHTPKILFLDEPTLGLDPQTRHQLWQHLKMLNENERITIFLTTHHMEEAERVAHRIAVIDHGQIVAQGSPEDLKAQTGTATLEQAFLTLTGSAIREEAADGTEHLRRAVKLWRR
jgi:ABC-2 type transport system ATP-binding protein